ncbi:MAG TPA: hypothetical protein VGF97_19905 [Rhizomicrobium sp.]|jgi:hypothetical protein
MSTQSVAQAFTRLLEDPAYRGLVARNAAELDAWDLDTLERRMLAEEAANGFSSPDIGSGVVMTFLRGAALPPRVASDLGVALNKAHGLPTASFTEPGFVSGSACCPWGHPPVPALGGMLE